MKTKIYDYGMNGEGVSKVDGKIILINNALIDEEVEFEVLQDYDNYSIAKSTTILNKNPHRTEPFCPYFLLCGGCQLQHMNYYEQLKFKSLLVKKTLKKILNTDIDVNPTVASDKIINYRNKMSFSVKNDICGLLQHNSSDIVDLTKCPLADETINKILTMFKQYINNNPTEDIKNLVIRHIENQTLVGIVCKKACDINTFVDMFRSINNLGIYQIINTRNDSVVLSGQFKHLFGIKEIKISNFAVSYSVDLAGFHQTNINIQNKLYDKVLNSIPSDSIVVNGFSGQGLLSAIIAQKAKKVIGIEINKSSHLSAEKLKANNKISNLTNILADFNKEIIKHKNKIDTIILDPTKKGCGKTTMRNIIGIKNIIYVSCNPIALAKDLRELVNDYDIVEVTPFDMFPNTTQVETLVRLTLRSKNDIKHGFNRQPT